MAAAGTGAFAEGFFAASFAAFLAAFSASRSAFFASFSASFSAFFAAASSAYATFFAAASSACASFFASAAAVFSAEVIFTTTFELATEAASGTSTSSST